MQGQFTSDSGPQYNGASESTVARKATWDKVRPWPVYMMAAALPISIAAVSVSKFLVLTFGLAALWGMQYRREPNVALTSLRYPWMVMAMLAALAASLTHTTASWNMALGDLAKYGKLLVLVLVPVLLRTRREALLALAVYIGTETFVLATSYLLALHLSLPWVVRPERTSLATVYSSYLDQSIMTVGMAALCWHLRDQFPGPHGRWLAIALALLAAINALFLLPGRSGHVALIATVSMAAFWSLPHRMRLLAVLVPVALTALGLATSENFHRRLVDVISESRAYERGDQSLTSSGIRINFWKRSLEAIGERPLTGFGVGSWSHEYMRLEGRHLQPQLAPARNPHNEYLMWAVQLGLGGVALLLGFFATLARDAWRFRLDAHRAVLSVLAILALTCLFNSILFDGLIGDYFCLILGLLFALGLNSARQVSPTQSSAVASASGVAAAGLPATAQSWSLLPLSLRRLAFLSATQPLSRSVPGQSADQYLSIIGVEKAGWRAVRRRVAFLLSGQNKFKQGRLPPGARRLLWIYGGENQIGDALMDLGARSLLAEQGFEVDLLAPAAIADLFRSDAWFARTAWKAADLAQVRYDCAIVLSNKHRPLVQKQRHFYALPWVSLQEHFTGPNFHRGLFVAQRIADLAGIELDNRQLAWHGCQKLGSAASQEEVAGLETLQDAVAIVVGGVDALRIYSRWEEVVRLAVAGGLRRFVLLGSSNASAEASRLAQALADVADITNFVGRLTLAQSRRVIDVVPTVVCADGGLMHVAVTTRGRVVALFAAGILPEWRLPPHGTWHALCSASNDISAILPQDILAMILQSRGRT